MKAVAFLVFTVTSIMVSCGPGKSDVSNQKQSPEAAQAGESAGVSVPGIEKLDFTDTITLKASGNMRFDKELFRVRAGRKIRMMLINTSAKLPASMVHNVVILKTGTDIADFADVARDAKAEDYVPSSLDSLVITHTKLVGGGDSTAVDFTISKAGVYDFICSFPGHWGMMQGKIVAQ